MKNTYEEKLNELFERIGDHAESVLATSRSNRVSARMMSVLIKGHIFYVQTDKTFRKYQDIRENPQVALCIGSIQIEGICEDIGHPLDNEEFCSRFKHHYSSSYEAYSHLEEERLLRMKPTFIQRWKYVNGQPIIEQYHIKEREYLEQAYRCAG